MTDVSFQKTYTGIFTKYGLNMVITRRDRSKGETFWLNIYYYVNELTILQLYQQLPGMKAII